MEELIVKYITRCITEKELEMLSGWLNNPKNKQLFNDLVKINYTMDCAVDKYDTEKAQQELLDYIIADKIKIRKQKFSIRILRKSYRYAAAVLLFLIAGYVYKSVTLTATNDTELVDRDAITLSLDNGKLISLSDEDTQKVIKNTQGVKIATQHKTQLNYNNVASGKLKYNSLLVPNGKRFQLKLSDGSMVFLNSGSSIKYPIKFLNGNNRKIYLEGEAFFEITKNEKQAFVVVTKQLSTKVLGTSFNVKAYHNDTEITVSVVTGKVQVSNTNGNTRKDQSQILTPNQQTIYNMPENTFVRKNCNASDFTAWKDSVLIFNQTPLSEVAKSLERWYGLTIIIESQDLKNRIIRGRHEKETINEVLKTLQFIIDFDFEIRDRTVIITEKNKEKSQ